jgi:hypothetical protein
MPKNAYERQILKTLLRGNFQWQGRPHGIKKFSCMGVDLAERVWSSIVFRAKLL